MNCGSAFEGLLDAVKQGLVSEAELSQNLRPLLRTRFKLGLLDPPGTCPYDTISPAQLHSPAHQKLALEAARKSIVMLKNNRQALPLQKDIKQLFVIGPTATSVDVLLGNYYGVSDQLTTVLEAVAGKVHAGTRLEYRQGFLLNELNVNPIEWAIDEAKGADAMIVVMGVTTLLEGEEGEAIASPYKGDRENLRLPESQITYLKKLRANNDKPIIVVLTGGSPMAIPEVHELADAVLLAWYPGEAGGQAVADVIFGDVSPSGKLPVTFPKSLDQLPPYEDYSMKGRTYRYMKTEPLYPFGFGLSYSTFTYGPLNLSKNQITEGENIEVRVKVSNTGSVAAEEVVQLYLSDVEASTTTPISSLKRFARVALQPGQSQEITFVLGKNDLLLVNEAGERVLEKGQFKLSVGGSSASERAVQLGAPAPQTASFELI
ncbi:MAG: hypothetical protein HC842_08880 [Cytophagales bacterium]|nr:hypothetical protein [Cytophagales bacterium]